MYSLPGKPTGAQVEGNADKRTYANGCDPNRWIIVKAVADHYQVPDEIAPQNQHSVGYTCKFYGDAGQYAGLAAVHCINHNKFFYKGSVCVGLKSITKYMP